MSKERAAKIASSPDASRHGGECSGSGRNPPQGGTTAQKKAAGRKGGNAIARKALSARDVISSRAGSRPGQSAT